MCVWINNRKFDFIPFIFSSFLNFYPFSYFDITYQKRKKLRRKWNVFSDCIICVFFKKVFIKMKNKKTILKNKKKQLSTKNGSDKQNKWFFFINYFIKRKISLLLTLFVKIRVARDYMDHYASITFIYLFSLEV